MGAVMPEIDLILEIVFWILGIGLAVAVLVPPLATALGFNRVTCEHLSPLPEVWARDFPIHPEVYEQLIEEGFELLGGMRLQYRLWKHSWCHSRSFRVFGGKYTSSFCLVGRPKFRGKDKMAFVTLIQDGGWICTTNFRWLLPESNERGTRQILQLNQWRSRQMATHHLFCAHRRIVMDYRLAMRGLVAHNYLPVLVDSCTLWAGSRGKLDRLLDWLMLVFSLMVTVALGLGLAVIGYFSNTLALIILGCSWLIYLRLEWLKWAEVRAKPGLFGRLPQVAQPDYTELPIDTPEALDDAPPQLASDLSRAIRPPAPGGELG